MKPHQTAASVLASKIGKAVISSQHSRILLSAVIGLIGNIFYALYHCILGIINQSLWFIALCAFYIILAAMRFSAVLCGYKSYSKGLAETEYFVMKLSGILLTVLSFILAAILRLSQNLAVKYDTIVMITIATYTFYKITIAVIQAIKHHGNPSPLLTVIRRIRYAETAASLLTLQRSMLVSFGSMEREAIQRMNIITGTVVCLFIWILGISMTIKGRKKGE